MRRSTPTMSLQPMAGNVTIVARRRGSTSDEIAAAWCALGVDARVLTPEQALAETAPGDVVIARLDVLESLDGIEPGLAEIETLVRRGVRVLNRPDALRVAHDKLETAVRLERAGLPQPRTVHITRADSEIGLLPPVVVKPRHGSWGRDVFRCGTSLELDRCLDSGARPKLVPAPRCHRAGTSAAARLRPPARRREGPSGRCRRRVAPPGEWRKTSRSGLGCGQRGSTQQHVRSGRPRSRRSALTSSESTLPHRLRLRRARTERRRRFRRQILPCGDGRLRRGCSRPRTHLPSPTRSPDGVARDRHHAFRRPRRGRGPDTDHNSIARPADRDPRGLFAAGGFGQPAGTCGAAPGGRGSFPTSSSITSIGSSRSSRQAGRRARRAPPRAETRSRRRFAPTRRLDASECSAPGWARC